MEGILAILQVLGIFIGLPVLIGFAIVGFLRVGMPFKAAQRRGAARLACTVDADCPPGYVCMNGVCVLAAN